MYRFIKKQGFTLIELMVVIVIIGVLASLAIPRFTEASSKAKIAEAPRVLASYESAFLAALAESGSGPANATDMIFEAPTDSKWFSYIVTVNTSALQNNSASASARMKIGNFLSGSSGGYLVAQWQTASITALTCVDCFLHTAGTNVSATAKKMVPNFINGY